MDLKGHTAVVTGGGRGLGRAFAQALGARGAKVVVIARSEHELDETVASIGSRARAFAANVTDAESVGEVFRKIGAVDVLVNNAGVLGPIGPFAETDFDDWWRTIDVNVRGSMLCMHAVLPGMIERHGGRIINIVTSAFSPAYLSAYLTSKTALIRATECIAAETKPHRVSIFSAGPGTVATAMTNRSLHSPEGQKWIPWFRQTFDQGLTLPPERPAAMIAALASGKYDALSGLYVTPFDDLDALVANRDRVEQERLHTLQIRPLKASEVSAALTAIRDQACRART